MNNFPAFRPKPEDLTYIEGCISDNLLDRGVTKKKDGMAFCHPLEFSEKHYRANLEKQDFMMLRNIQGLHAPLRLQMERKVASQVQRLSCLPSSHLMLDTLTGKLDSMDFQDVLNDPMSSEKMGQPHMLMEEQLGIL